MAIVVVGGNSRSVGKTSVVAGLIAALREYNWTAFKITQYGHGICSLNGKQCQCATDDHNWAITEEKDRSGDSDTSRFLASGAARVWWVRTEQGRLAQAMPAVRTRLCKSEHAIIESNSILNYIDPDLYLTVIDPKTSDFKTSAQKFLNRADAILLHNTEGETGSETQRTFPISPPGYLTDEIVEFVRSRIGAPLTATHSHTAE